MRYLDSHCPREQQQERRRRHVSERFVRVFVSLQHVTGDLNIHVCAAERQSASITPLKGPRCPLHGRLMPTE